jgi:predicted esterase
MSVIERTIPVGTHGRYLLSLPVTSEPAPMLVGFHGYGEGADVQLARMQRIPGAERWLLVSIQGLHRFYQRRANEVVASWMTRQDRETAIADNAAYVAAVLDAVEQEGAPASCLVLAGFSQGVAMMFRTATSALRRVDGIIAVGGDVPPELTTAALGRVGHGLVCHGTGDEWYTAAIFQRDVQRLRESGAAIQPFEFAGGHEWSDDVVQAAATFLRERWP